MKRIDRVLQTWRIQKVLPYVKKKKVRLLDIGCADGVIFKKLASYIQWGVGVDPDLIEPVIGENYHLIPGAFPNQAIQGNFDIITALAVFEHIPPQDQSGFLKAVGKYLADDGLFILTVPAHFVDHILYLLKKLRIIDGMSLEEHYGLDVNQVVPVISGIGFSLKKWEKFQLGLNNLFVFTKKNGYFK